MIEFDPNNIKGPKAPVWASYIPVRHPQFKTHTQKNHAYNAIGAKAYVGSYGTGYEGIVYQHIDGEWVEIDRYIPPTHCAHCEQSFADARSRKIEEQKKLVESGELRWVGYVGYAHRLYNKKIKPIWKNAVVCEECYDNHFSYSAKSPIPNEWVGQVQPIA